MAQRYEVEAWVNPEVWDDQDQAAEAIEQIMDSGTEDEEIWVAICRRLDGATVETLAAELVSARSMAGHATSHLRGMVKLEWAEDSSYGTKGALARRAGISRPTLDDWLDTPEP